MKPLLEVVDLCVTHAVRLYEREVALSGVSFAVERGETLGVHRMVKRPFTWWKHIIQRSP